MRECLLQPIEKRTGLDLQLLDLIHDLSPIAHTLRISLFFEGFYIPHSLCYGAIAVLVNVQPC